MTPADLDPADLRILGQLQLNGRITNAELAERIGLSPAATHKRVRRLEEDGVIHHYAAVLDQKKCGRAQSVFVQVSLSSQKREDCDQFEARIARSPLVIQCHLVSGDFDYLVHVLVRDTEEYESFHHGFLSTLPHVSRITSSFVLRTVRHATSIPLPVVRVETAA